MDGRRIEAREADSPSVDQPAYRENYADRVARAAGVSRSRSASTRQREPCSTGLQACGTRDCKVLSGTAVSFVSGSDTSRLVQIDHVVALGWAWHHGAWAWTDDQRLLFANDPANLVAATDDTNQSKSDAGPGEWLPPAPELRCGYVEQFVGVLGAYGLAIGAEDREAAEAVLVGC
ncbi:uncharacterized protein DUF1524 [Rathayibacter sp. PhB185]|nr:uncharacterized protein DUF1524 [Rathayibacter sp. PhB186]ROS49849.1 uncharacterized protein DUF1524 [Rathayibacter sp. PhB185]